MEYAGGEQGDYDGVDMVCRGRLFVEVCLFDDIELWFVPESSRVEMAVDEVFQVADIAEMAA